MTHRQGKYLLFFKHTHTVTACVSLSTRVTQIVSRPTVLYGGSFNPEVSVVELEDMFSLCQYKTRKLVLLPTHMHSTILTNTHTHTPTHTPDLISGFLSNTHADIPFVSSWGNRLQGLSWHWGSWTCSQIHFAIFFYFFIFPGTPIFHCGELRQNWLPPVNRFPPMGFYGRNLSATNIPPKREFKLG